MDIKHVPTHGSRGPVGDRKAPAPTYRIPTPPPPPPKPEPPKGK